MSAKSQPETANPTPEQSFSEIRGATVDAVSAIAQANERIVGKLIELSSSAALETVRTYAEIQSAFIDAVRAAPAPGLPSREGFAELGRNPLGWYDKQLIGAANVTERVAKLVETNARIVAQGLERFGAEAEQATTDIKDAVTSCVGRIKELRGWNSSTPASSAS